MKVGDLVRNKASGQLAIVTGQGEGELQIWITLFPISGSFISNEIVYLAEYFEVISES